MFNWPELPTLADFYADMLDNGEIPAGWEDAQKAQYTSPKDWPGYLDYNNNRLIIDEGDEFRTSVHPALPGGNGRFPTAAKAMAHLDRVRTSMPRRFGLVKKEDPGIFARGVVFFSGMVALEDAHDVKCVRLHADLDVVLRNLPEDVTAVWLD